MTGAVALSARNLSPPPGVGDMVTVEILLNGRVGGLQDQWKIGKGEKWIPSGSLTLLAPSLRVLPSEADTTKLALEGMVHQPGPLSTGELTLIHVPTAQEIKIEASSLSVTAPAAQQQTEAPWTLPTVAIGGWNYTLIGILALIFLALLTAGALRLYRRFVKKRQKNHKEKAISALNGLQKYARSRKGLQQEEWKRFSFELAGILRRFSDENFHIDTSDMTDREFLAELRLQPRARSQVDSLAGLLSMIDEVRYGKKHLEVTLVPGLLLEAKKFVETTFRPEEETRS